MRSVLITAANSGLGLPTTLMLLRRGCHVIATTRSSQGEETIRSAAVQYVERGLLTIEYLDLSEDELPSSIVAALKHVDGVINNAGTGADLSQTRGCGKGSALDMIWSDFESAMWVNANGARRIMKHCVPFMSERNYGRIVNVSSARASLENIVGEVGAPCYDISKTVLNALTAHVGHELQGSNVLVNSVCPGWCATSMGGSAAPDTPEQGAARILHVLDLPADGPNGKFFMNNQVVPF